MPGKQRKGAAGRPWRPGDPSQPAPSGVSSAAVKAIVDDVLAADMSKIDARAEELALSIAKAKLSASQVRNFYGAFVRMRTESDREKRFEQLKQHRSRLAYLTARANGKADSLWEVFNPLLRESRSEHVEAICSFAEAIVAYHKYFEEILKKQGEARNG